MKNKVANKKTVAVNFSCAVFCLLYFLILEDGLSRNVGK